MLEHVRIKSNRDRLQSRLCGTSFRKTDDRD
jgi:hypothetical protein